MEDWEKEIVIGYKPLGKEIYVIKKMLTSYSSGIFTVVTIYEHQLEENQIFWTDYFEAWLASMDYNAVSEVLDT